MLTNQNLKHEFAKAGLIQMEQVMLCDGSYGMQFYNPNAEADYQDYLARLAAKNEKESSNA